MTNNAVYNADCRCTDGRTGVSFRVADDPAGTGLNECLALISSIDTQIGGTRFRVGWIDTRIADPDQDIPIVRLQKGHVPQTQHVGTTIGVKNHCAHL